MGFIFVSCFARFSRSLPWWTRWYTQNGTKSFARIKMDWRRLAGQLCRKWVERTQMKSILSSIDKSTSFYLRIESFGTYWWKSMCCRYFPHCNACARLHWIVLDSFATIEMRLCRCKRDSRGFSHLMCQMAFIYLSMRSIHSNALGYLWRRTRLWDTG